MHATTVMYSIKYYALEAVKKTLCEQTLVTLYLYACYKQDYNFYLEAVNDFSYIHFQYDHTLMALKILLLLAYCRFNSSLHSVGMIKYMVKLLP